MTEKDNATGLDHTWFRKNESQAGRWTSPDPYNGSMNLGDPQSYNRYSYVENDPVNYVDPSGLNVEGPGSGFCIQIVTWGHYTNEPDTTYVNTRTICFGGSSGGSIGSGHEMTHGGSGGSASNNPSGTQIDKKVLGKCLDEIYGVKLGVFRQGEENNDGVISISGGKLEESQVFYLNVTTYSSDQISQFFETTSGILSLPPGIAPLHQNTSEAFFVANRYGGSGGYHLQGTTMYIGNDVFDSATSQVTAITQYLDSQGIGANSRTSLYACIRGNKGFK